MWSYSLLQSCTLPQCCEFTTVQILCSYCYGHRSVAVCSVFLATEGSVVQIYLKPLRSDLEQVAHQQYSTGNHLTHLILFGVKANEQIDR